jgi:hypothetical protein
MILFIKTKKTNDNSCFIAQVDWSKGDAGNVGTPGTVRYGNTEKEAKTALKTFLESQGHTVKECCINSNICQELNKCMYERTTKIPLQQ